VSCFGHGSDEAAVSFIDWNAVYRGMMGMFFSVEAEFAPVRLPEVPSFFDRADCCV